MSIAAPVLLVLGGCRGQQTGEATVTVIADRLPRLGDPVSMTLAPADLMLVENAAQGLVRFDAGGNIVPGLAERWAVSDDGLSYVFRLRTATWSDGRKVRARDVVRLIQRQLGRRSRDPLSDTLGAVREVVAMTDRVIAIELSAPRPHLLQLLAQPQFGLVRERRGTGPFTVRREETALILSRTLPGFDGDEDRREEVRLLAAPADRAQADFLAGRTRMVLGGTVSDIALPLRSRLPRGTLRIDPVSGLFGLAPARRTGPAADRDVRALLDAALDRTALVTALGVPGLQPRTSLLQPGLEGIAAPVQPDWVMLSPEQRRAGLGEAAARLFPPASDMPPGGPADRPTIRIALPAGTGGAIILERLKADWQPLGLQVLASEPGGVADFRWIDQVAPSSSPAWFLRSFRCEFVPVCSAEADQLLDAARLTGFAPQRSRFFADAERIMREEILFIPVAAPVRWSLVDREITGFAENRFARHSLADLRQGAATRD